MTTIHTERLSIDPRSMLPIAGGPCRWRGCGRRAVTFAYTSEGYAEGLDGVIPVCRGHILAYRVRDGQWQAEDEFTRLQFARRARWRWLAQRRILRDQRAAVAGRESRAQRRLAAARAKGADRG